MELLKCRATSMLQLADFDFTKIACVKLKLHDASALASNHEHQILQALSDIRSRDLMAARFKNDVLDPSTMLTIFDSSPEKLRNSLQPLEERIPERVVRFGTDCLMQYVSLTILDFGSPDFRNNFADQDGQGNHFRILVAFLESIKEQLSYRLVKSGDFVRLSKDALRLQGTDGACFIKPAFVYPGQVQLNIECRRSAFSQVEQEGLQSGDRQLFLAPCGVTASWDGSVQFPDMLSPLIRAQRICIAKWLAGMGFGQMDENNDAGWLSVHVDPRSLFDNHLKDLSDDQCLMQWPASLCFQLRDVPSHELHVTPNPFSWFQPAFAGGYEDGLQFCCEWSGQRAEREAQVASSSTHGRLSLFSDLDPLIKSEKLSPSATARDQQDATSTNMIYPTPSDGTATHATPGSISIEGSQNVDQDSGTLRSKIGEDHSVNASQLSEEEPHNSDALDSTWHDPMVLDKPDNVESGNVPLTEEDLDFFTESGPKSQSQLSINSTEKLRHQPPSPMAAHSARGDVSDLDPASKLEIPNKLRADSIPFTTSLTPEMVRNRLSQSQGLDFNAGSELRPSPHLDSTLLSDTTPVTQLDSKYASHSRFDFRHGHSRTSSASKLPETDTSARDASQPRPLGIKPPSHSDGGISDSEGTTASSESDASDISSLDSVPASSHIRVDEAPDKSGNIFSRVLPPVVGETLPTISAEISEADLQQHDTTLHLFLEQCYQSGQPVPGRRKAGNLRPTNTWSRKPIDFNDDDRNAVVQHVNTHVLHEDFGSLRTERSGMNELKAMTTPIIRRLAKVFGKINQRCIYFPPRLDEGEYNGPFTSQHRDHRDARYILDKDVFALTTPMVKIQRASSPWDMLPSAVQFWETLGLGPAGGCKNIHTFCLYPGDGELKAAMTSFLEQFGASYRSQRLGTASPGFHDDPDSAFAPVRTPNGLSFDSILRAYCEAGVELAARLARGNLNGAGVAIFAMDPFGTSQSKVTLCGCFQTLLKGYKEAAALKRLKHPSRIEFRILALKEILEQTSSLILPVVTANKLAHEVYGQFDASNRVPRATDLSIRAASSVELAPALPRSIPFTLSEAPPPHLLLQDSCLHIAYAVDKSNSWLTAAWVDNTGEHAFNSAYCLMGRPVQEIIGVIWQSSLDMISTRKVRWRLFVVRAGITPRKEREAWRDITRSKIPSSVSLSLLSLQTEPSFHIDSDHMSAAETLNLTGTTDLPASGVSTPSSGQIPSITAASTPSATPNEMDSTVRLVDPADDSWALLFSQPAIVFEGAETAPPPAASGLLLKRPPTHDVDAPVFAQVDLLFTSDLGADASGVGAVHDGADGSESSKRMNGLLKEIFQMYHRLAFLARIWGVEAEHSTTPWHVAVAQKCAAGLGEMLEPC